MSSQEQQPAKRRKQHLFQPAKFSMFWVIKNLMLGKFGREQDLTSYIASFCGVYRYTVMFKHASSFLGVFLRAPNVSVSNLSVRHILDQLMVMCVALEYTPKYCGVSLRMDLSPAIILPAAAAYASLLVREDNTLVVISRDAASDRQVLQQMFDLSQQHHLMAVSEEVLVQGNWVVDVQNVEGMSAIGNQAHLIKRQLESSAECLLRQWSDTGSTKKKENIMYCVIDSLRPMWMSKDAPTEETICVMNDRLCLVMLGLFRDR